MIWKTNGILRALVDGHLDRKMVILRYGSDGMMKRTKEERVEGCIEAGT